MEEGRWIGMQLSICRKLSKLEKATTATRNFVWKGIAVIYRKGLRKDRYIVKGRLSGNLKVSYQNLYCHEGYSHMYYYILTRIINVFVPIILLWRKSFTTLIFSCMFNDIITPWGHCNYCYFPSVGHSVLIGFMRIHCL